MLLENVSLRGARRRRASPSSASDPDGEARRSAYLLPRFLDPTAGEIRIDGKNIRWVTLRVAADAGGHGAAARTSIVHRHGGEQHRLRRPELHPAADHRGGQAGPRPPVHPELPYGYETLIGDGGHSLRPGEKFRIALARAILRDPSVIVIEEPDEPMDEDTQALLDDTFARVRRRPDAGVPDPPAVGAAVGRPGVVVHQRPARRRRHARRTAEGERPVSTPAVQGAERPGGGMTDTLRECTIRHPSSSRIRRPVSRPRRAAGEVDADGVIKSMPANGRLDWRNNRDRETHRDRGSIRRSRSAR